MRIGIDCRLWNESGVGRYTRNLIAELVKIDETSELVLFCLSKDVSSIKYQVSSRNWKVVVADIRWHSLAEQLSFVKILNQQNLDLVHFPYFSVPIFYRRPFVVTIHDLILNRYPTGRASTLPLLLYWVKHIGYQFVIAQAVARARRIITVSRSTQKEIKKQFSVPENKIEVIYEGVDEKVKSLKLEVKSLNERFFLYVGNAYPHKNLDLLINAFAQLQEGHPDVSLILVGKEDHFYKRLKDRVKSLKLDTKILFYGYATDEELSSLYKSALALVYPSKMEGFGLPLLEAMSHGCVVLASDIPVFHEIGGDAVVYFDNEKMEDLSKRMQEVLVDKSNFENYVIKGLERVKDFSWKKMAQETLAVYNAAA